MTKEKLSWHIAGIGMYGMLIWVGVCVVLVMFMPKVTMWAIGIGVAFFAALRLFDKHLEKKIDET